MSHVTLATNAAFTRGDRQGGDSGGHSEWLDVIAGELEC